MNKDFEEFEEYFWSVYPIDQYVRMDGNQIVKVIQYVRMLEARETKT